VGGERTSLREKLVHLAACAVFDFALLPVVFVAEEVVSQKRVVNEGLKDDVEETRLSEI